MANAKDWETTIAGWYANVPHLPTAGRQWLADNVWWLALIGGILSVIGLLGVIPILFALLTFQSMINGVSLYANVGAGDRGPFALNMLITAVSYVVTTVILLLSVSPLRAKARRGWELLFWSFVVETIMGIAAALIGGAVSSLISTIVAGIIGGYFLFEIRDHFGGTARVAKKAKVVKNKAVK